MGAARHADGMNINMYVVNAILVLMVVRQIREHSLDLRALAVPVLTVGAAAVMFLHSVPGGGAHGQHRDGQGPQVQGVLADLADDHQDEDCVDHVHVDVHAVSVPRGTHPGRQPTGGSPG